MQSIGGAGGIDAKMAPDAFHRWATHYQKCRIDFQSPHKFSPVPYFLVCRVIKLDIKARLLRKRTQDQVKKEFRHDLLKAYNALETGDKILNQTEEDMLRKASDIYKDKGFEYYDPEDALTGYKEFPDLTLLDSIETKLIESYDVQ